MNVKVSPVRVDEQVLYEVTTYNGEAVIGRARRRFDEFRELRRSVPAADAKFPSRSILPSVSSALGLDEGRAAGLEAWLDAVASRDIAPLRVFLGLEEDDSTTAEVEGRDDEVSFSSSWQHRAVDAERRLAVLEHEKTELSRQVDGVKQARSDLERARLAVARDRDTLLARVAALEAERASLAQRNDALAQRHADLLLRVGTSLRCASCHLASRFAAARHRDDHRSARRRRPPPPRRSARQPPRQSSLRKSCRLLPLRLRSMKTVNPYVAAHRAMMASNFLSTAFS